MVLYLHIYLKKLMYWIINILWNIELKTTQNFKKTFLEPNFFKSASFTFWL